MPYKIFTYRDPYSLHKTDFWSSIKEYPQLCSARTLVNSMYNVLGENEIKGLLCPLDDIIDHFVYWDWKRNISKKINQYSAISDILDKWQDLNRKSSKYPDIYFESLKQNKQQLIESLRMFIELGIKSEELDTTQLNTEHRIFKALLKKIEGWDLFTIMQEPTLGQMKDILIKQCKKEREEREERKQLTSNKNIQKYLDIIDTMTEYTKAWDGKHLVIHGMHQYNPLQLRLITSLEKQGMEIIFIYNYLPEYRDVYSSWDNIYQLFGVEIKHDKNIKTYQHGLPAQPKGNAIACNMALLCEKDIRRTDKRIGENYKRYKGERVIKFDNISEYGGYVEKLFSEAIKEKKEKDRENGIEKGPEKKQGTSAVLRNMKEVIYTANKDVDELMQVYFPEYSRTRHFLAYPIGQFFSAMYNLWNEEIGEIDFNYPLIRECLNSGILTEYNSSDLLKTMLNLGPLFDNITTFSEFTKLYQGYKNNYDEVQKSVNGTIPFAMKSMSIYNPQKVTEKDIKDLDNAIQRINIDAKKFFGGISKADRISIGAHFKKLQDFVDKKKDELVEGEEKELIEKLLERLNTLTEKLEPGQDGTLQDIRDGLYFFLKEKEEPVSDWFVRNFEQIDGDVLQSAFEGFQKIYHFGCVSEKDMCPRRDELLPWPLSELFIERAYNPKDLRFQVFYEALGERRNFLRYALFYGLYFCKSETKISYVYRNGDDHTSMYELLHLIGLEDDQLNVKSIKPAEDKDRKSAETEIFKINKYDQNQASAMFLCPYRYLQDYVLKPGPIINGSFLMGRFCVNLIIENTWKILAGQTITQATKVLNTIISQQCNKIKKYFPCFRETDFLDYERQAINYILHSLEDNKGHVKGYSSSHMDFRKSFGVAKFYEDPDDSNSKGPYEFFDRLTKVEDEHITYSVHSLKPCMKEEILSTMTQYINNTIENYPRVGGWCTYCDSKGICLEPYSDYNNKEE